MIWLDDIRHIENGLNRIFSGFSEDAGYPGLNLWTGEDRALVTAEVPGVQSDNIDISMKDNSLTISVERKAEEISNARFLRGERPHGKFARTIRLPFRVDASRTEATFKNGVLTISMHRAEEDKPRKIKVN